LVIQLRVVQDFHHRMNRAGFWIVRPIYQALQSRMNQCSGTHRARFNCNKQFAVSQPMVTEVRTGLAEGNDFGMGAGVVICDIAIPASSHDLPIANNDSAHGDFAHFQGTLGGTESVFHPKFVGGGRWLG
jgi:hypothetical protein